MGFFDKIQGTLYMIVGTKHKVQDSFVEILECCDKQLCSVAEKSGFFKYKMSDPLAEILGYLTSDRALLSFWALLTRKKACLTRYRALYTGHWALLRRHGALLRRHRPLLTCYGALCTFCRDCTCITHASLRLYVCVASLRLYVCTYVRVSVCIYMYIYIYIYLCVHIYIYVHVCIYIHVCIYMRKYTGVFRKNTNICTYIYIHMYI